MSILMIIAILGVILGVVAFVMEIRNKGKRSLGIFIGLIVSSIALFVVSMLAGGRIAEQNAPKKEEIAKADTPKADDDKGEVKGEDDQGDNDADKKDGDDVKEGEGSDNGDGNGEDNGEDNGSEGGDDDGSDDGDNAENGAPKVDKDDPLAPKAVAGENIDSAKVGETIAFTASKSQKNNAPIESYRWDFGDGGSALGRDVKHAYEKPGSYSAVLTVTDKDGHAGQATRQIEVNRPNAKIRFIHDKIDNEKNAKELPTLSGTYKKDYSGSVMTIDVTTKVIAAQSCTCELILKVSGPECELTRSKEFKNGTEGTAGLKAVCKSGTGEYSWKVDRKATGSGCGCTWVNLKIDGNEV